MIGASTVPFRPPLGGRGTKYTPIARVGTTSMHTFWVEELLSGVLLPGMLQMPATPAVLHQSVADTQYSVLPLLLYTSRLPPGFGI